MFALGPCHGHQQWGDLSPVFFERDMLLLFTHRCSNDRETRRETPQTNCQVPCLSQRVKHHRRRKNRRPPHGGSPAILHNAIQGPFVPQELMQQCSRRPTMRPSSWAHYNKHPAWYTCLAMSNLSQESLARTTTHPSRSFIPPPQRGCHCAICRTAPLVPLTQAP